MMVISLDLDWKSDKYLNKYLFIRSCLDHIDGYYMQFSLMKDTAALHKPYFANVTTK